MILTEGIPKCLEKEMHSATLYAINPTQTSNGFQPASSRYLRGNSFHDFPTEIIPNKIE